MPHRSWLQSEKVRMLHSNNTFRGKGGQGVAVGEMRQRDQPSTIGLAIRDTDGNLNRFSHPRRPPKKVVRRENMGYSTTETL